MPPQRASLAAAASSPLSSAGEIRDNIQFRPSNGGKVKCGRQRLATGSDDLLWIHVTSHVAFFVALAAHLGTNLRLRILTRML